MKKPRNVSIPLRGDDLLHVQSGALVCIGNLILRPYQDHAYPSHTIRYHEPSPPCPVGCPMRVHAVALPFVYLKMPPSVACHFDALVQAEPLVCIDTRVWNLRLLPPNLLTGANHARFTTADEQGRPSEDRNEPPPACITVGPS